jgi:outer membrane protein TolC
MKKIIIILISVLSFFSLQAQEELNAYLETAAKNNPGLKVKFNQYMAALEVVPQVGQLPDPSIAFGFFVLPVETREGPQQAKFSANQMFPWFGTLKAKENIAIQLAKAKFEGFEESKSRLFNDVKSTYFNLYFLRKASIITSENIAILKSFQKLALIKIEAGKASVVDELRVEMEINDLENELELLKDRFNALSVVFNKLLNVDANAHVSIPDVLWDENLKADKMSLKNQILEKNHQLLSLDYQFESLLFKQEVAQKSGLPNINIGVDYTAVGKGENNLSGKDAFLFPKIGITIPIYRNKYKSMVNEVVYLQQAKKEEKLNKENILESIFENVFKDYRDANRRIKLFIKQAQLATQSLKIIETHYATNGKEFEEVLRMEKSLLKYNLELEKAHADKHAAIAFINYLKGN